MLVAAVDDAAIARQRAFIYCVFAPALKLAYIGETRGANGALGRFAQHLGSNPSNTFTQRARAILRADELMFGEVLCGAVPLSDHKMLQGRASDHRQAVEALTMYRLINEVTEAGLGIIVISRVRFNAYRALRYVVEEADRVTAELFDWLSRTATERGSPCP